VPIQRSGVGVGPRLLGWVVVSSERRREEEKKKSRHVDSK
jgi:hypothetical protein